MASVKLATRGRVLAQRARDVQSNVSFQIWLAPIIVAIPLAWAGNEALKGGAGRAFLGFFLSAIVALGAAGVAYFVSRRSEAVDEELEYLPGTGIVSEQMLAGGHAPQPGSVDVVVTWMSRRWDSGHYKSVDDMILDPGEVLYKLINGFDGRSGVGAPHAVLIVSYESAKEEQTLADHSPFDVVEWPTTIPNGSEQPTRITVVVGPSLNKPEADKLLRASRAAVGRALEIVADNRRIMTDVTWGTIPASLSLYEASTERSIPVTWWRFDQSDKDHQYLVPLASV